MTHVLRFLFFIAFSPALAAEELHFEHVSEINFYPTWNKNPSYIPGSDAQNYYLFANTRLSLTRGDLAFEVAPEVRGLESSQAISPASADALAQRDRLMNLSRSLSSTQERETVLDVERLNLTYLLSGAQLSLGRKPVSLGVLNIFPVWNKFSRPLITDDGPLRVYSQDQASLRLQSGPWLIQAVDIEERGAHDRDATRIGELTWFGEGLEVHVIGGEWWQSGAFGLAAVKDVAGTSLKLEEISFSADGLQMGAGAERALNEWWSGLIELMYLESGAAHARDYLTLPPSRFRPLNARAYAFTRAEYKPSPLWILQLSDLLNAVDSSQLWDLKGIYSAANDLEFTLEFRLPTGADDSELSRHALPVQLIGGVRLDF